MKKTYKSEICKYQNELKTNLEDITNSKLYQQNQNKKEKKKQLKY